MNTQILNLDSDEFIQSIATMPSAWLANMYTHLYKKNDALHDEIDELIEQRQLAEITYKVIDAQIECFDRLLTVGKQLISRNISMPIPIVVE